MYSRSHLLEAVARSLADPIFVIDYDGRYIDVIGGDAEDVRKSADNLLGRSIHEVLPVDVADKFLALIRSAIDECSVQTSEFLLPANHYSRQSTGAMQWFEGRISPINCGQQSLPICIAWTIADITRRKQLEQRLRSQADTDELTGLFNRRLFLRRATEELARAHRYGRELHLALIDLDHFKHINDQFGHPVGDALLKHVSRILEQELRQSDLLARIGGEEFAILLPDTNGEQAIEMMRRLQSQIRAFPLELNDTLLPITFSVGITSVQHTDQEPTDLLKRVDKMLYHAKNLGRNRICGPETVA